MIASVVPGWVRIGSAYYTPDVVRALAAELQTSASETAQQNARILQAMARDVEQKEES